MNSLFLFAKRSFPSSAKSFLSYEFVVTQQSWDPPKYEQGHLYFVPLRSIVCCQSTRTLPVSLVAKNVLTIYQMPSQGQQSDLFRTSIEKKGRKQHVLPSSVDSFASGRTSVGSAVSSSSSSVALSETPVLRGASTSALRLKGLSAENLSARAPRASRGLDGSSNKNVNSISNSTDIKNGPSDVVSDNERLSLGETALRQMQEYFDKYTDDRHVETEMRILRDTMMPLGWVISKGACGVKGYEDKWWRFDSTIVAPWAPSLSECTKQSSTSKSLLALKPGVDMFWDLKDVYNFVQESNNQSLTVRWYLFIPKIPLSIDSHIFARMIIMHKLFFCSVFFLLLFRYCTQIARNATNSFRLI